MEGHESAVAAPSTDLPQDEAGVSGHDIRRVSETEWFAEIRAMSAQRRRLMDPPSGPSAEDIQREKERKGERARAGVEDLEVLQEVRRTARDAHGPFVRRCPCSVGLHDSISARARAAGIPGAIPASFPVCRS